MYMTYGSADLHTHPCTEIGTMVERLQALYLILLMYLCISVHLPLLYIPYPAFPPSFSSLFNRPSHLLVSSLSLSQFIASLYCFQFSLSLSLPSQF